MKWFFPILLGIFLSGYSDTSGADWKYHGQTQTASYFCDVESIIRQENIGRFWVKAVYSKEGRLDEGRKLGGKYRNLTESIALLGTDCKNKRHRVLALIVYSMEGEVVISDIREREGGFIVPESILENLYKTVCK